MNERFFLRCNINLLCIFFLLAAFFPGTAACRDAAAHGFVDVKKHIPSIVIDMRYHGPHNFIGRRVDGYNAPKCLLTIKAAQALAKVQADLEKFSFSLKIYDCYRPQRAVDHFVRWAKDIGDTSTKNEFYPTVDKKKPFQGRLHRCKIRPFTWQHRGPHNRPRAGSRAGRISARPGAFRLFSAGG